MIFILLFPMAPSVSSQSPPAESLYVNMSLASISQVSFLNGTSWFQTTLQADITYHGSDPPTWIGFAESSVPAGTTNNWTTTFADFGNSTWIQIGTLTWKPLAMVSGPFTIPGHYVASVTGDINSWPNENISFIFAFAVSTVARSGVRFNAPVAFNFDNANSSRVHYYTGIPTVINNFTGSIYGSHVFGQKVRVDLSHSGTILQGLPIVQVLRILYIPLIAVFAALVGLKGLVVVLSNVAPRSRKVAELLRRQMWLLTTASYGSRAIVAAIGSILGFTLAVNTLVLQYVPPWVSFFGVMMGQLLFSFILLLIVSVLLLAFGRNIQPTPPRPEFTAVR